MAERLTREQWKGLTAEEETAYQNRLNAARVAAYRAANKEYNRTYKKYYVNRPENKDKYKELNKMNVNKFRKQQKEVLKALTTMSANRNADKLENDQKKAKETIEKGQAISARLMKV